MNPRLQSVIDKRQKEVAQAVAEREAKEARRAELAKRVREAFPVVSSLADEFRELFGDGIKLRYGIEPDGRQLGKPGPVGVPASESWAPANEHSEPQRIIKTRPATRDRWYARELEEVSDE